MILNGHIISTRGKRLHSIEIPMTSTGLTRPVIYAAEQAAKTWARENGHKVISDIVSQGEYRAWAEPKRSAA